jgi:hypothetical protein
LLWESRDVAEPILNRPLHRVEGSLSLLEVLLSGGTLAFERFLGLVLLVRFESLRTAEGGPLESGVLWEE